MNAEEAEMEIFGYFGKVAYGKIIAQSYEGASIAEIYEAIERLAQEKEADTYLMYILAGMECAAVEMGHHAIADYISSRLDELVP